MMQENSLLDTLLYLFDYLLYEKGAPVSTDEIHSELNAAGFPPEEISRAMDWLLDLDHLHNSHLLQTPKSQAIRLFSYSEREKITEEAREFLFKLTREGIIDSRLREIIIQKLMLLDETSIGVKEVKWVALIAVYNRSGQEQSSAWFEQSLSADEHITMLH